MAKSGFVKNVKYYRGTVYEFNLPTGTTCPFAMECKVTVDRVTGKFNIKDGAYTCYAAANERFPGVRRHRWENFRMAMHGQLPEIPKGCKAIRIHMSGDFFNQDYFDLWLKTAAENPEVEFWAYTKSLRYWVKRINDIPANLVLTASQGGREDYLINMYNLKNVVICKSIDTVPEGRPIDTNDDYARMPNINFALLDNYKTPQT